MSDKKQQGVKDSTLGHIVVTVLLLIAAITLGISLRVKSDQYVELKERSTEKIEVLGKEINGANIRIIELTDENLQLTSKLKTLEDRLEGIKDKDGLLLRDMLFYIDHRYRSIPKTVAAEISLEISTYCKQENLPPELIMGLIEIESRFNPTAISKKGARGLMQIMPEWAKKFNLDHETDLHDISTNIEVGTKVLKIHIGEQGGNVTKGLYYYSGKSQTYADRVYSAMGKFVAFRATVNDDSEDENS